MIYNPIELTAAQAAGYYQLTERKLRGMIEVNVLFLMAAGLVNVQLFGQGDGTLKLSGLLPLNANVPLLFRLPPGYGLPCSSGEIWLQKSAAVQIGGFIGVSQREAAIVAAIEDEGAMNRVRDVLSGIEP